MVNVGKCSCYNTDHRTLYVIHTRGRLQFSSSQCLVSTHRFLDEAIWGRRDTWGTIERAECNCRALDLQARLYGGQDGDAYF